MANVDTKLRDKSIETDSKEPAKDILYYLNRELIPVVRGLLAFVNRSWGVDVNLVGPIQHKVVQGEETFRCDATDGQIDIFLLPSSEAILGVRHLTIKRLIGSSFDVNWVAVAGDDVDGDSTDALTTPGELVRLKPRGSGYDIQ